MVSACPPNFNTSSPLQSLWVPTQVIQLQQVSPWPSCFIAFFVLWHGPSTCLFSLFLIFILRMAVTAKSTVRQALFWSRLGDLFVSQNPREFNPFYSPGQILVCACTIWLNGQISISFIIIIIIIIVAAVYFSICFIFIIRAYTFNSR